MHGLGHVFGPGGPMARRGLWTAALLLALATLLYQVAGRVRYYGEFHHETALEERESRQLTFPAVTLSVSLDPDFEPEPSGPLGAPSPSPGPSPPYSLIGCRLACESRYVARNRAAARYLARKHNRSEAYIVVLGYFWNRKRSQRHSSANPASHPSLCRHQDALFLSTHLLPRHPALDGASVSSGPHPDILDVASPHVSLPPSPQIKF
ncbi:hypothetical protein E2I00_013398 [Balaenoptera physalus]|uniref:Uncharacterized protein n=1 Tax=Balaenoptera physalus TaxID=9770 RepID=A0A643C7B1_BALPH|nr:hypothetical protein E2I00_013398 [Balaenoptera physalus]